MPARCAKAMSEGRFTVLPKEIVSGRAPSAEAELDLAARGRVEMRAERHKPLHDRAGGVGLHGIVDVGVAETRLQRAVVRFHDIDVEDKGWAPEILRRREGFESGRDSERGGFRPREMHRHGHLQ
jgi:hypothetical protein